MRAAIAAGVIAVPTILVGCTARAASPGAGRSGQATPSPSPAATQVGAPQVGVQPRAVTPTVVIDPGHNGQNWAHAAEIARPITVPSGHKPCDTTGTSSTTGYTESAYNLDVAVLLAPLLAARGVNVLMTRTDDHGWGPCIDQRVDVANRAAAGAVVSVHADGWPTGRGFYVLYAAPAPDSPAVGDPLAIANRRLAVAVRDAVTRQTGLPYSTYGGRDGLMTVPYPTLYHVPEVLVETANMRSPTDAALLDQPSFRAKMAASLAEGVTNFLAGRA